MRRAYDEDCAAPFLSVCPFACAYGKCFGQTFRARRRRRVGKEKIYLAVAHPGRTHASTRLLRGLQKLFEHREIGAWLDARSDSPSTRRRLHGVQQTRSSETWSAADYSEP